MKILLDTSAYVGFKRNNREVVETIVHAELIIFSPIVLAELIFGFRNGSKFDHNMKELREFVHHTTVHLSQVGEIAADRYSRIASQLRAEGKPIPTNDIWIAAQTMEHGAELITFDRHFENIKGLVYTLIC